MLGSPRGGKRTLSRPRKSLPFANLSRRDFLARLGQGTALSFMPSRLWNVPLLSGPNQLSPPNHGEFVVRPRYRNARPVDAMLSKVEAGSDRFVNEKYAEEVAAILGD